MAWESQSGEPEPGADRPFRWIVCRRIPTGVTDRGRRDGSGIPRLRRGTQSHGRPEGPRARTSGQRRVPRAVHQEVPGCRRARSPARHPRLRGRRGRWRALPRDAVRRRGRSARRPHARGKANRGPRHHPAALPSPRPWTPPTPTAWSIATLSRPTSSSSPVPATRSTRTCRTSGSSTAGWPGRA